MPLLLMSLFFGPIVQGKAEAGCSLKELQYGSAAEDKWARGRILCLQSSTFPLHIGSSPERVHYFPPLHMANERPVKRFWMQCQPSWSFSPFLGTKLFSSTSAPRGGTSSVAALSFPTDQKASCSLYAQAICGKAPTVHSLLTRRISVEGAV